MKRRREVPSFRRALKAKVPTASGITRERVFAKSGGKCYICGFHLTFNEMTIDHVYPLSRGGPHTMGNVEAAHRSCNEAKGDRTLLEMQADGSLRSLTSIVPAQV